MSAYEFEEFYTDMHKDLYSFIFSIARKDHHFADDIFQNTMENAFNNFHKLHGPNKAKPWLFAIAKNEASRYFHKHKKHLYPNVELLENIENDILSEPDFSVKNVQSNMLADVLKKLTDEEQSIIVLHYYNGMKLKEIAEIWNQNKNTLKSKHRRCLHKIKGILEEEGYRFE